MWVNVIEHYITVVMSIILLVNNRVKEKETEQDRL